MSQNAPTLSTPHPPQARAVTAPIHPPADAEAVALLRGIVEIQSLSSQEGEVARFLALQMASFGLQAHVDEAGNAVGIRPARTTPSRDVVLLGHMDTVPGVVPVRVEGDLLYGRGSVDAKGPLATFAVAAATANVPDDVRLIVVGAVEEECATSKGAMFAASQYRPAACIIGEPSHADGYTLGYKGRLLIDITISTNSSHSAGPDPTSAELGIAWWNGFVAAADAFNAGRKGVFDQLQPRLRRCRCEHDGLLDVARLHIGVRLPPGVTPARCEEIAREVAASTLQGMQFTLVCEGGEVAYQGPRSSSLARAFSCAIRDMGGVPKPKVKTGTSDMNVVAPIWNCPIVAYGPGDSALDHTPNEHISITEYLRAIATLRRVLETLEL